jgi:hypothetical protein
VTVDDGSIADVGLLKVTGEVDIAVEDVQRGAEDDGVSVVDAIVAELRVTPEHRGQGGCREACQLFAEDGGAARDAHARRRRIGGCRAWHPAGGWLA